MSLTRKEALELIAELKSTVEQWNRWSPDTGQLKEFAGRKAKPITEPVKQAMIAIGEAFRRTDIQSNAREIALAVDDMFSEFSRWAQDYQVASDAVPPFGTDEIWQAYRRLVELSTKHIAPPPPHAIEMRAQGDTTETIAKRFGWYTENGHPDLARVNRELSARIDPKEGIDEREYDPENWVHPLMKKLQREIDRAFEERNERLQVEISNERPPTSKREPCKESWDELAEYPGITLRQIALMKRVSEDEAREKLNELGYIRYPGGYKRSGAVGRVPRGKSEPEWLEQNNPHDECDELDARIIACAEDGLKPKSIADLLTGSRGFSVTPQKVAQVLRRHKEAATT